MGFALFVFLVLVWSADFLVVIRLLGKTGEEKRYCLFLWEGKGGWFVFRLGKISRFLGKKLSQQKSKVSFLNLVSHRVVN